jgi:hypothetical protein
MRNDPFSSSADKSNTIGLANVLTGYAALAIVVMFIVGLLVAGHRHTTGTARPTHAAQLDFGVEELNDLYATEPAVTPLDFFTWPRPRPVTRAELDLRYRQ